MKKIVVLGHGVGVKLIMETLLTQNNLESRVVALVTHPLEGHQRDIKMIENRKEMYGEFAYNVFNVEKDYNIPVFTANNVNELSSISFIKSFAPDYIISIGCRDIIRKEFLKEFSGKVFNIHTTPLPRYRGAASDSWMILNGEWGKDLFGVFHEIDEGLDTGRIIAKSQYRIPNKSYPIDVFKSRMSIFPNLIEKAISALNSSSIEFEEQDHYEATTFPRLFTPKDGRIDFKLFDGVSIERFIYAFGYPFEGAHCFLGECKINILEADFFKGASMHPKTFGLVFGRDKDGNYKVSVNGGLLLIKKIERNNQAIKQSEVMRLGRMLN
jgi:methionyl-tRNA formyltransferase